jgi:hypothetical protein
MDSNLVVLAGSLTALLGFGLLCRYGLPGGVFKSEPPRNTKIGDLGLALAALGIGLQLAAYNWF